jgi:predicted transcriptional regulator
MKPRTFTDLREEMRAVARGERLAPPPQLSAAELVAALTPEMLEMLRVLGERRPATVGELVTLTQRSQPSVSRALRRLTALGLIRLVKAGREVRPELRVGEIRLQFLSSHDDSLPPAIAHA